MNHDDHFALAGVPIWLLVCAITLLLGWFGPSLDDHSSEWVRSDLKKVDQRDDDHRKQAFAKCLTTQGLGAAPMPDVNGVIVNCEPRWGKKS
jgi:hypothetical protein